MPNVVHHAKRARLWSTKGNLIRDELVLEAHLDADEPYALLRREGEPGMVRVYLNEVRYLISALGSMAAEVAMVVTEDDQEQE